MTDCFWGDALVVLSGLFWSAVVQFGAPLTIHTLLTGCVFECDLAHRRSVAALCMLYKIGCNPMKPLYLTLPVSYVPVRVTRDVVIAHRCTYAPSCCRTLQYRMTFFPLSVSLWNDLGDRVFDEGAGGFQEKGQCLFITLAARFIFVSYCFPFFLFHSTGWYCGAGVFGLVGC